MDGLERDGVVGLQEGGDQRRRRRRVRLRDVDVVGHEAVGENLRPSDLEAPIWEMSDMFPAPRPTMPFPRNVPLMEVEQPKLTLRTTSCGRSRHPVQPPGASSKSRPVVLEPSP